MNTENKEDIALQLARIIYPDQEIVSARLDDEGMLHAQIRLNKPVNYIQFTTEVKDVD